MNLINLPFAVFWESFASNALGVSLNCRRTNRISQATTYLRQALQLNPMLWEAYEELCGHDKGLNPNEIFCCENVSSFYPWAALEPLYESSRMISSAKSSSPSLNR